MKLPLPHRKVIRFVGKDAQSFIQGLFSNDVLHFEANPSSKNIVYGAFLNGNGRVVTDGFVFYDKTLLSHPEHSPAQEIFAEIDGSSQETSAKLLRHLEAFKMRADVKMSVVEDVKVEVEIKQQQEENTTKEEGGLTDPRSSMENVTRSYSLSNNTTNNSDDENIVDTSPYFNYLYERGVCEGDKLWSQIRLPFEGNLDIIGGIHYRKGCYIGQELVQRAKTQLVSRKRIVPFQSTHPLSVGMDLINLLPTTEEGENKSKPKKKPAVVGKVIDCIESASSKNNTNPHIGVCSLRLAESLNAETLEATLTPSKKEEAGGVVVKISANVPYWWPDDEIDKCIPLADEGEDGGQGEKDE